jgi:diaminopimelate decarboxylase
MVYIREIIKPPRILAKNAGRKKYPSKIYGISCDGTDLIIEGFEWEEAFIDERIVFDNVGAYSGVLSSKFNDFEKTREITYISKENRYEVIYLRIFKSRNNVRFFFHF